MNNSMTERRIHDPQCEDASAGREEVEFSTEICRERDTKKARATRKRLNIRESDQKIKNKHKGTEWKKQCPQRVVEKKNTKKARATRNKEQTKDKKIKNKTLENYMNL